MGLPGQSMGISTTTENYGTCMLDSCCIFFLALYEPLKEWLQAIVHRKRTRNSVSIGLCCIFRSSAQSYGHISRVVVTLCRRTHVYTTDYVLGITNVYDKTDALISFYILLKTPKCIVFLMCGS